MMSYSTGLIQRLAPNHGIIKSIICNGGGHTQRLPNDLRDNQNRQLINLPTRIKDSFEMDHLGSVPFLRR